MEVIDISFDIISRIRIHMYLLVGITLYHLLQIQLVERGIALPIVKEDGHRYAFAVFHFSPIHFPVVSIGKQIIRQVKRRDEMNIKGNVEILAKFVSRADTLETVCQPTMNLPAVKHCNQTSPQFVLFHRVGIPTIIIILVFLEKKIVCEQCHNTSECLHHLRLEQFQPFDQPHKINFFYT